MGAEIVFLLKGGERRSFSMANPPHDDEFVQLHVRHVPGGNFTTMASIAATGPLQTRLERGSSDSPAPLSRPERAPEGPATVVSLDGHIPKTLTVARAWRRRTASSSDWTRSCGKGSLVSEREFPSVRSPDPSALCRGVSRLVARRTRLRRIKVIDSLLAMRIMSTSSS